MSIWLRAAGCGAVVMTVSVAPLAAQAFSADRLQVHGYLTQGFGGASDLPIYGLEKKGSGDFRVAALQFRYAVTPKDNVVFQFEHRRMGSSLINTLTDDVTFDWGFYQHRFGQLSVKAGKMPLPMGIFTGYRDVGTILPFYRAPFTYYPDSYETIDGALVGTRLDLGHGFTLAPEAYAGGLNFFGVFPTPVGPQPVKVRANGVYGGQAWLELPIKGLRLGGGYLTSSMVGLETHAPHVSIDGNFERFFVRGEFMGIGGSGTHLRFYYAQAGVHVTRRLGLNGQAEFSDNGIGIVGYKNTLRDVAGGATFAFTQGLVAKFEQHHATGFGFDQFAASAAGPRGQTWYSIASLAVSF